jgi:hypothetical protein
MTAILLILGVIGLVIVASLVLAFPVMWLWNYVMPTLTVEPLFAEIGFWQALCLSLLCSFLFKNASINTKSD